LLLQPTNRKWYMARPTAVIFRWHWVSFKVIHLLHAYVIWFSYSYATVGKISTDRASRGPSAIAGNYLKTVLLFGVTVVVARNNTACMFCRKKLENCWNCNTRWAL